MAIFAVIQQPGDNGTKLPDAVAAAYGQTSYVVQDGVWLVAGQGTAQDVSNKIGITDGAAGAAVVLEAASYFGRANPAIWSWIKANWEGPPIG
jgi:Zn-dependent M28 family amino/carboxypeptidase